MSIADILSELTRATVDKRHPFRYPVLGTVSNSVSSSLRIVVLRKLYGNEAKLFFHTDLRSKKVSEIREKNQTSFLFYHPKKQLQLIIKATAIVHYKNDVSLRFWKSSSANSVKGYTGKKTPGTFSSEYNPNLQPVFFENVENLSLVEKGYENFVLIENNIVSIEALQLRRNGHIRMLFQYDSDTNEWKDDYLIP